MDSLSAPSLPVSPTRPPQGWLARVLAPFIDADVFDFWAARLNRSWSWQRPLARVVGRHEEAQGAVTLVLRPNRHWRGFAPGQHLLVGAEVQGRRLSRSYSLTSVPQPGAPLSITVKAVAGGALSQHLCQRVRVGDVLEIGQAFGGMAVPSEHTDPLLFLAAGSGITPLMGLTRWLAGQGMPVDVTLLYWARTRAEVCFARELRTLTDRHRRLTVRVLLTRETPVPGSGDLAGRLDAGVLRALVPDLGQRRVLACGPAGFVQTAGELAMPLARAFQAEAFTLPGAASAMAHEAAKGPASEATVKVHLRASGRTVLLPTGQALLPALEAQGVHPAHGCRMGICNTCACAKLEGATQDIATGQTSQEPTAALRLCISRACSDLTLDL